MEAQQKFFGFAGLKIGVRRNDSAENGFFRYKPFVSIMKPADYLLLGERHLARAEKARPVTIDGATCDETMREILRFAWNAATGKYHLGLAVRRLEQAVAFAPCIHSHEGLIGGYEIPDLTGIIATIKLGEISLRLDKTVEKTHA